MNRRSPLSIAMIGLIDLYRYSLSAVLGRWCRHLPTCSEYTREAIVRHGAWAGGWIGFARLCRCRPGGTSGLDFVCERVPEAARPWAPWRYGLWRRVNPDPPQSPATGLHPSSRASGEEPR
jgi:hypothetical protein